MYNFAWKAYGYTKENNFVNEAITINTYTYMYIYVYPRNTHTRTRSITLEYIVT